jgi:NAD(P)-dependent dehydrogenase (short-subunit alcohol dehydrogenase family)
MSGRLGGKVAIVTGGASGIGRATCRLFAREGAAVVVADVDEPGGRRVADDIVQGGGRATFHRLDVAVEEEWTAAIEAVLREHGRLDVLVNNAGIGSRPARAVAERVDLVDWNLTMAVNATASCSERSTPFPPCAGPAAARS